ncbi:MAG: tetratricopeptide repeat protein [Acidobacteriota bacterium]
MWSDPSLARVAGAVLFLSTFFGCVTGPQRAAARAADELLASGQAEKALAAYREGRRAWPDDVAFPFGEGAALYTLERYAEAESPLREAIRLAPGDANPQFFLGHVLSALGRHDEAVAAYEVVVRLEPIEPRGWKALGFAEYNRGRYPEARVALQKYLAFARDAADFESVRRLIQALPTIPPPGNGS